jgi:formylglycine-generating enzyme required for sulfatase activity
MAVQYAVFGCWYRGGSAGCAPAPVGFPTLGAGLWGQLDMAGEENEWNLDCSDDFMSPCVDCARLSAKGCMRVNRGGNFATQTLEQLASFRASSDPGTTNPFIGFRCARSP